MQPHLYDAQIPPVVYLSGTLMFVAGLAIWTVLVTLTGWVALLLGLLRMFMAGGYRQQAAGMPSTVFMVLEALLLLPAVYMTYKAYSRE